jgi:hypothetical protein
MEVYGHIHAPATIPPTTPSLYRGQSLHSRVYVRNIYIYIYPFSYILVYLSYEEEIDPLSLMSTSEELLERKEAAPV